MLIERFKLSDTKKVATEVIWIAATLVISVATIGILNEDLPNAESQSRRIKVAKSEQDRVQSRIQAQF